MSKNPTVYTGRVGARLRPTITRGYSRRVVRPAVRLSGGPLGGATVPLTFGMTLSIVVRGKAGHYAGGSWVPESRTV